MKKLSKTLNKIFNDKKFLEYMSKNCHDIYEIQQYMGDILNYYISTRDTKIYSYKELCDISRRECNPKNLQRKETVDEALKRNIIDEGVVTHSFNGFTLKNIKRYGLGNDKIYDKTLGEELAQLEKDLGVSEYVGKQTNDASEIFYSSPGINSIYYAMQHSPERLFHGPLYQGDNALPVIVGEKKEDYYLRVAIDKINKNYRLEDQPPIIENAKKVITKLCSQRPQIALIPINSKKFTLNASIAEHNEKPEPLNDFILRQLKFNYCDVVFSFFSNTYGGICRSNCSNLFSTGVCVPASELEFVSIPDSFEIKQIMALQMGFKPGEKFDLKDLKKIEEKSAQKDQSVIKENTENINQNKSTLLSNKNKNDEFSF